MSASSRPLLRLPRSRVARIASAIAVLAVVAGGALGVGYAASAAGSAVDPGDAIKPVAAYTFDGDSGTRVVDTSGSGNDAAWKGTPAYVAGVSGQAASVSGGANYVKLPLVAGKTDASSSFSYEFWMAERSRTSYGPIVSNQDFNYCNNAGITLYNQATPGTLEACWGQTAGGTREYVHDIQPNVLGAWHHIAVVVDRTANTATFYVDGVEAANSPADAITADTAFQSGFAFNIGGLSGSESDTGDGFVNASVDDFAFFDQAIPAQQVAADYTATKPTVVNYTITYDGNGAAGGSTAAQTVTAGQSVALTKNGFTRPGYRFVGWATSPSGQPEYTDGQAVSGLASAPGAIVNLYAVWNRYRAAGDTVAPIVSYDFDADSGSTVADSSGNGFSGSWSGTPSYGAGIDGKAAYVNSPAGSLKGVNVLKLPLIAGRTDASSSFSYVFWLNQTASSSDSPIVSNQDFAHCYNKGTTLYNTAGSPGVLRACFGRNGTSTSQNYLPQVSPTSVMGVWHQVAVVADRAAGTMTAYLDGVQTARSTGLTSAFALASGFPFTVGAEGSGTDQGDGFVNAFVDDFDFYDSAVSADQIQNDFRATRPATGPATPGSTVPAGFVSDTFRAPEVRAGTTFTQRVAGLFNGGAATFSKVAGDGWLSVDAGGVVTGTAPAAAPADPATITVQATDGTTTAQLTVEVRVLAATAAPQLATATWNLWDAGSHVDDADFKDLAVIAADGLDVIGLQEDDGTVAERLAKALGWYAQTGDGVSLLSAYPLAARPSTLAAGTLPAVSATADVLGHPIRLWSVGLDAGGYGPEALCRRASPDAAAAVAAEKASTRYGQAKAVAAAIAPEAAKAAGTPVIVLSDLESPSAADWTAATSAAHCGAGAVDWPVPDLLTGAGLTDSFRAAHADPAADAGVTWSPLVTVDPTTGGPEPQDRIDYVHYAGSSLSVLGSNTLVAGWPSPKNIPGNAWTSDHRAVVTTFAVGNAKPAPVVTVGASTAAVQRGTHPSSADLLRLLKAASTTAGARLAIDDSAVDVTTVGDYRVTVTATDPATGLTSAPVDATVRVVPVIALTLGHSTATFQLGRGDGLTAARVLAALKPELSVPGTVSVDLSAIQKGRAGRYPVTVTGTDGYGFTARASATVTITIAAGGATTAPTGTPSAAPAASDPGSPLAGTGSDVAVPVIVLVLLLAAGGAAMGLRTAIARRRRL
ncbi:MAG: LamG-like jellyroll fold domain-containing protein [Leifsonia sp.]|uniref:LamG-like jellyroll fold domain-containing protein n=1 Tax=Leifsonia sp. TaxID=1870902 RepID=UPI003F7DA824